MDIRDRVFVAKVARFLFQLSKVPLERRQHFKDSLIADKKLRRKLGLTLIILLDHLDDVEKPDFGAGGVNGPWNNLGSIFYSLSSLGQSFVEIVRTANK